MAKIWKRFQSPGMYVGIWWIGGFIVTAVFIEMGDFGIPMWLVPVSILFAFTVGLPTLLALIVSTFVYEFMARLFGIASPLTFAICLAAISLAAHSIAFLGLVRLTRNWGTR